ncbi:hypothetical protein [Nonomuraea jiangxiensis]|uniref:Uncharacterized protein n=1 Tax=Nonomuraea jiangxiensis TaxID=633440 RepID=A0A1G9R335_9ACTN|nr:hypothetical protein [Nonomuraea jiangxiensis]SDM17659.1 hypothetical protein SAMN05421869_137106 [Nonomuraea jiangxiensis]
MAQESFRQENQEGPNVSQNSNSGQNIYITNIQQPTTPTEETAPEEPPEAETKPELEPEPGPEGCGWVLIVIAVIVGLIILVALLNNGDEGEPESSKPYPAGVTNEKILQPVSDTIYNCAKEPVLAPRTCPQKATSIEEVSKVRWSVHGYPTDGADIQFDGSTFTVDGTAVLSIRFREGSTDRYEVHIVPYRAKVFLDSGQLRLGSIVKLDDISSRVKKQEPALAWEDIKTQVRAAFDRCASSKQAPMPPGCPNNRRYDADDAIWTLESNPVLNAVKEFDETTGVIHALGSYSIHLDGVNFFGRVQGSQAGDYDAWVIFGDTGIEVLDIRHE